MSHGAIIFQKTADVYTLCLAKFLASFARMFIPDWDHPFKKKKKKDRQTGWDQRGRREGGWEERKEEERERRDFLVNEERILDFKVALLHSDHIPIQPYKKNSVNYRKDILVPINFFKWLLEVWKIVQTVSSISFT